MEFGERKFDNYVSGLIERLMMQVEHVLVVNQLQVVTAEVVETARENLIIGPN